MAGSKITKDVFGKLPDGRNVERIVLRDRKSTRLNSSH